MIAEDLSRKSLVVSDQGSEAQVCEICKRWLKPLKRATGENPFQLREQLENLMWTKVGVVRNGPDMQSALPAIEEIRERINSASAGLSPTPLRGGDRGGGSALDSHTSTVNPVYNAPWNEAINTENLARVAEMLTRSALAREESRGAHYRSDFPERNVEWLKNVCIRLRDDGRFDIAFRPVEFTRLTPEELREKGAGLKSVVLDDE
jgi:succinate dehydrogenase / fumarate reductase flavoprotein subunit/fumarate reductase flavoprotein subunit